MDRNIRVGHDKDLQFSIVLPQCVRPLVRQLVRQLVRTPCAPAALAPPAAAAPTALVALAPAAAAAPVGMEMCAFQWGNNGYIYKQRNAGDGSAGVKMETKEVKAKFSGTRFMKQLQAAPGTWHLVPTCAYANHPLSPLHVSKRLFLIAFAVVCAPVPESFHSSCMFLLTGF